MKKDRFKKIGLAIAIAIVLVAFFNIGIQTFYPQPNYEQCYEDIRPVKIGEDINNQEFEEQQDKIRECENTNKLLREPYERNVFIILMILGFLSLVIGLFLKDVPAVYTGLIIGGLITLMEAIIRYWNNLQDYVRFVLLGIILIILIYIGYKKLR